MVASMMVVVVMAVMPMVVVVIVEVVVVVVVMVAIATSCRLELCFCCFGHRSKEQIMCSRLIKRFVKTKSRN